MGGFLSVSAAGAMNDAMWNNHEISSDRIITMQITRPVWDSGMMSACIAVSVTQSKKIREEEERGRKGKGGQQKHVCLAG